MILDLLQMFQSNLNLILEELTNTSETLDELLTRLTITKDQNVPKNPGLYLLTSTLNKKKSYVGKSLNEYARIAKHKSTEKIGRNEKINSIQVITRAIRKHGWKNFEIRILYQFNFLTQKELGKMDKKSKEKISQGLITLETLFVSKYNLRDKEIGYNVALGGTDCTGSKWSEQTRNERSGENSYWFGKKLPQETIDKISGEKHWNFGKTLSEEVKQKMSFSPEHAFKRTRSRTKSVNQLDKDTGMLIKTWDSASFAAKHLNRPSSLITRVCKNKTKSAYGFGWKYAELNNNI